MQLTQQEIFVLRKTFLFHRLTPAAYMKLSEQSLSGAFRSELRGGQLLEWPTEDQNYLGVVISGELVEHREPTFSDRTLKEADVLGVVDLFSCQRAPARDIEAVSRSRVVFFTAAQIRSLFDAYPGMMMRYINFLTARAQELRWEYLMAATPSALERVKKYCAANLVDGAPMEVSMPKSMSTLAGRLHMSRSTLYRCLEQLEGEHILKREGKRLLVADPTALRQTELEGAEEA